MIDLQNIEIGFKHKLFEIENISLVKGNLYVLIGANGRGKTTFLKTLIGEVPSLKGHVLINKKVVKEMSRVDKSKNFTFVGSKQQDVDFLKVKDYVALGRVPYTNLLGTNTLRDIEKVNSALGQLGITHLQDKFTNELSDGEKQLVAIAKSLAQETDIIILDEPTAFLDYSNRMIVLNLLKQIAAKYQKCILFSSHDIDSILELNTSILLLNQHQKQLTLFSENTISKQEIISQAF